MPPRLANPSAGYRPEIDGLRAIAVLAVVLYHAKASWLPGGFVGVDVFFVVSGYLITLLLAREHTRTGRVDYLAFFARRARRLLPALIAMILVLMGVAILFLGRHQSLIEDMARSSASALLLVPNFHFQGATGGYFDPAADTRPMLHLWSLGVEEQFYLVYPFILALLLRFVPSAPIRRLALIGLASLLLAEYWVHLFPERAFYQMPARFWELATGGAVALSTAPGRPRRLDHGWVPLGTALVLVACWATPAWGSFPGLGAVPAVAGAGLVLLGIHRGAIGGRSAAALRSPVVAGIGLVSYSFYLWHWPMLVLMDQARLEPAGTIERLAACGLSFGLAWLSWRFVETPFRRGRVRPARALAWSAAAAAMTFAAATAMAGIDRIPEQARAMSSAARTDLPAILPDCHFDSRLVVRSLLPDTCQLRPGASPRTALWGDSHALAWQPFAWRLADEAGGSAASATRNACAPGHPDTDGPAGCPEFNRLVLDWLASGGFDTLVVGQRWPIGSQPEGPPPAVLADRVESLERAFVQLAGVRRILVIGPLPAMRRPAPDCIALGWERECGAEASTHRKLVERSWKELEKLALRFPNVQLVDPTDYFCDDRACPPSRFGFGLYWDGSHITASASRGFAERYLSEPARYTRHPTPPALPADVR